MIGMFWGARRIITALIIISALGISSAELKHVAGGATGFNSIASLKNLLVPEQSQEGKVGDHDDGAWLLTHGYARAIFSSYARCSVVSWFRCMPEACEKLRSPRRAR